MSITIQSPLCSGCGICSRVCPYLILRMDETGEKASVDPAYEPACSRCGHCQAICPEGAIKVTYEGAGPVPDLSGLENPTPDQFAHLVMMRRSVREYRKKPVPREVFSSIFDIIRYAPSGMNGQSVSWTVMEKPGGVEALVGGTIQWARSIVKTQPDHVLAPILPMMIGAYDQGIDRVCHGAPHLVIAHGPRGNPVGYTDAIIALTHFDLAAPVFGLGTCWAGILTIALWDSPEMAASAGVPDDHAVHYAMMTGYPKYPCKRVPPRNEARVDWR